MSEQLPLLKTTCENCTFAQFTDGVQSGCEAGFLDKFRNAGSDVQLTGSYYVINNRICMGCRLKDSTWTKQYNNENLLAHMKEETRFRCDVVVVIDENHTIEDVKKMTDSIFASSIKPEKVVYVYRAITFRYAALLTYINSAFVGKGIKWQIKNMEDTDATMEDMVADAAMDTVAEFCTVWVANSVLPSGFIEQLRVWLREEMKEFILILPNEKGEGLVVLKAALKAIGGNAKIEVTDNEETYEVTNFIDKMILLARAQEKQRYVWTHEFQPLQ